MIWRIKEGTRSKASFTSSIMMFIQLTQKALNRFYWGISVVKLLSRLVFTGILRQAHWPPPVWNCSAAEHRRWVSALFLYDLAMRINKNRPMKRGAQIIRECFKYDEYHIECLLSNFVNYFMFLSIKICERLPAFYKISYDLVSKRLIYFCQILSVSSYWNLKTPWGGFFIPFLMVWLAKCYWWF